MCASKLRFIILSIWVVLSSLSLQISASTPIEIDLMVYHTRNDTYMDVDSRKTRQIDDVTIKHMVAIANTHYKNSGLDIKLRHIHSEPIDLTNYNKMEDVLTKLRLKQAPFDNIDNLRNQYGADMVTVFTPYDSSSQKDGCGLAYVPGSIQDLKNEYQNYSLSYVRVGRSATASTLCNDSTLAHELGHNMGINHSPKQSADVEMFKYGRGHGVIDNFVTVMPYASAYVQNKKSYQIIQKPYFSTPKIVCQAPTPSSRTQYPCGTQTESDAVRAIKQTAPIIAAFYPTKVRDKMEIDHTSTSDGAEDSGGSLGYLILTLIFILCCRLWIKTKKD